VTSDTDAERKQRAARFAALRVRIDAWIQKVNDLIGNDEKDDT